MNPDEMGIPPGDGTGIIDDEEDKDELDETSLEESF